MVYSVLLEVGLHTPASIFCSGVLLWVTAILLAFCILGLTSGVPEQVSLLPSILDPMPWHSPFAQAALLV